MQALLSVITNFYRDKINKSKILDKLKISKNNYTIISIHRNENLDIKNKQILQI